jgi:MOSC domain-containing protein YiiM
MKVLSVNVSLPREVPFEDRTVTTGIFKKPANGQVTLRALNFDGDGHADPQNHGGIHRAAYVYSIENYAYWQRELGRNDFIPGQFGENLTVEGMLEDQVHIGDVFRVGGALVEVTQPRVPCFKLGIRMNLAQFPKMFLASCRVGFYVRVLEEGGVGEGDALERTKLDPEGFSVREMCHLLYFDKRNWERAAKALRIPALSPGWRRSLEKRLAKAGMTVEYGAKPKGSVDRREP